MQGTQKDPTYDFSMYLQDKGTTLDLSLFYSSHPPLTIDQIINQLPKFFESHPKIKTLKITRTGWSDPRSRVTDEGAIILATTNLHTLHLPHNKISNRGAIALARNKTFTALYLQGNHISNEGAIAFSTNDTVQILNLSENRISDEGARAFIKRKKNLKILNLNNNSNISTTMLKQLTYRPLKINEEEKNEVSKCDTITIEKNYQLALQNLKNIFSEKPFLSPEFKQQIKAVSNEIENLKTSATSSTVEFYTEVLRQTYAVVYNPTGIPTPTDSLVHGSIKTRGSNQTNLFRYQQLAEQAEGARSCCKKLAGLMFGILGMVILTFSILCAIASFGISTPLSAVGIVVGLTWLAKAAAMTCSVVGLLMTFSGIYLFRRQGLSKMMKNLATTSEIEKKLEIKRNRDFKMVY